jgi:ubiquinone/menaquinone biosynthesis C-methylase UbiE
LNPADDPDRSAALKQYRRAASGYDRNMRPMSRWQRSAVEKLELRPGDVVIDVACGTGLLFPLLQEGVGPSGRIIGIDLSPEMLAQAQERVADHGWDNIVLTEAAVEQARIDLRADAALFSFTHDVLQSPLAVANVVAHLKPGARVASGGGKFAGRNPLVNFVVRRIARSHVTTFRGFDRPWRELEQYTDGMRHRSAALGGVYVAWGQVTEEGVSRAAEQLAT